MLGRVVPIPVVIQGEQLEVSQCVAAHYAPPTCVDIQILLAKMCSKLASLPSEAAMGMLRDGVLFMWAGTPDMCES